MMFYYVFNCCYLFFYGVFHYSVIVLKLFKSFIVALVIYYRGVDERCLPYSNFFKVVVLCEGDFKYGDKIAEGFRVDKECYMGQVLIRDSAGTIVCVSYMKNCKESKRGVKVVSLEYQKYKQYVISKSLVNKFSSCFCKVLKILFYVLIFLTLGPFAFYRLIKGRLIKGYREFKNKYIKYYLMKIGVRLHKVFKIYHRGKWCYVDTCNFFIREFEYFLKYRLPFVSFAVGIFILFLLYILLLLIKKTLSWTFAPLVVVLFWGLDLFMSLFQAIVGWLKKEILPVIKEFVSIVFFLLEGCMRAINWVWEWFLTFLFICYYYLSKIKDYQSFVDLVLEFKFYFELIIKVVVQDSFGLFKDMFKGGGKGFNFSVKLVSVVFKVLGLASIVSSFYFGVGMVDMSSLSGDIVSSFMFNYVSLLIHHSFLCFIFTVFSLFCVSSQMEGDLDLIVWVFVEVSGVLLLIFFLSINLGFCAVIWSLFVISI